MKIKGVISLMMCIFIMSGGILQTTAKKSKKNGSDEENSIETKDSNKNLSENESGYTANGNKKKESSIKHNGSSHKSDKKNEQKSKKYEKETSGNNNVEGNKENATVLEHLKEISKNNSRIDELYENLKKHGYMKKMSLIDNIKTKSPKIKDINTMNFGNNDFMASVYQKLTNQADISKYLSDLYIANNNSEDFEKMPNLFGNMNSINHKTNGYQIAGNKTKNTKLENNLYVDSMSGNEDNETPLQVSDFILGIPKKNHNMQKGLSKTSQKRNIDLNKQLDLITYLISKRNADIIAKYMSEKSFLEPKYLMLRSEDNFGRRNDFLKSIPNVLDKSLRRENGFEASPNSLGLRSRVQIVDSPSYSTQYPETPKEMWNREYPSYIYEKIKNAMGNQPGNKVFGLWVKNIHKN